MHYDPDMRIESARKIKGYAWQSLCFGQEETTYDLFSQYLLKMQLLDNNDENVQNMARKLNYDLKYIKLFPDVIKKLQQGENPCRNIK